MNAQEIIAKIKEAGAATMQEVRDVLEDGAALAAMGITDEHQEAVEEAHEMTFVPKTGGFIGYVLSIEGEKDVRFDERRVDEMAERYGFDAAELRTNWRADIVRNGREVGSVAYLHFE